MTRKFFKTFFTSLCVLSVVLFVAVCGLWARSYWFGDDLTWSSQRDASMEISQFELADAPHGLLAFRYDYRRFKQQDSYNYFKSYETRPASAHPWLWPGALPAAGGPMQVWFTYDHLQPTENIAEGLPDRYNVAGLRYGRVSESERRLRWFVVIPLWLLAEIVALPAVIRLLRWWVRRQDAESDAPGDNPAKGQGDDPPSAS